MTEEKERDEILSKDDFHDPSSSKRSKPDFFKRLLNKVDTVPISSQKRKKLNSRNRINLHPTRSSSTPSSLQGTKLNMLSILGRARKTLEMVYLEVNLSRKALGLKLIPRTQCKRILTQLEDLGLVSISRT